MIMKTLLFEIGSEEIPARFVNSGLEMIKRETALLLERERIGHGSISGLSTPRRLSVMINEVSETQSDITVESVGPPARVAFDDSGAPTRAAAGFARSINIDVDRLYRKKTPKGEYIAATVDEKGRPTIDVLSEKLPELIKSLQLPKSMRWGNGEIRYYRPIHWITAILGKDIIPFSLDGIQSGNKTYGHRFLDPESIVIDVPESYSALLKHRHVVADYRERRDLILSELRKEAADFNVRVVEDEELLDIVANLVERPDVVGCSFDKRFLELPRKLLTTVMKSHQKYFSTESDDGKLNNVFMVISNTSSENAGTVRRGAERVLRARLEDARFYFMQDRQISLDDMVNELNKVTFQDRLGSVYEKTQRVQALALRLAELTGASAPDKVSRASMLCKADLVSGVVGEFPELQGYMGMVYASISGEDEEVASAVYEHYLPGFAGDRLPDTNTGTIASIADKADNIASFFSLGLIPSGSEDPFALRRQAAGIIQMLREKEIDLDIDTLIDHALSGLSLVSDANRAPLKEDITRFFSVRLEGSLSQQGYPHDIIKASLASSPLSINRVYNKAETLSAIKSSHGYQNLIPAARRVYNILAGHNPCKPDKTVFLHQSEKELYEAVEAAGGRLNDKGPSVLFELIQPINVFFDSVLVMDNDDRIRNNRLALLFLVREIFDSFGDFSRLED